MAISRQLYPRIVYTVRVVAHYAGEHENHWSIYLLLDAQTSVRINMRAQRGFIDGQLNVTDHNYIVSNSALRSWDYLASRTHTVGHYVSLILNWRRDKYNMSGGGSGCRW